MNDVLFLALVTDQALWLLEVLDDVASRGDPMVVDETFRVVYARLDRILAEAGR